MASLFDAFSPNVYQSTGGYQPTQTSPASANPPSGGRFSAPGGTQDQYDAYLGGKPSQPLMNSATGKPLDNSGQVDESKVDTRTIWSRLGIGGGLGRGLETGAMIASMIPGGKTIGENIQQVSGALHNLPLAELEHAYQMGEPGLARAKELSGIQLTQAQTQEASQRGEYFSTRNQASILSQQLRGQSAERLRAESGKAQPYWGVAPESGVSPHGTPWKKGEQVWGYRIPNYVPGNPNDPTDPGKLDYTFEPHSTEDEEMKARWGIGGGHSFQQQYIGNYMQQFPQGVNGDLDPSSPKGQQALMDEATKQFEQTTKVDPAIAAVTGGAGVKNVMPETKADEDKLAAGQQAKADDEAYQRLKKIKPGINEEQSLQNDTVAWATAQNSQNPDERKAAGDSPFDYHTKTQQANQSHDAQLDQARSSYLGLPQAQRKGFTNYLLQNGYDPKTRSFAAPSQQPQVQAPQGTQGSNNTIYWDGKNYRKHSDNSIVQ
jgi:hypothetical protein